MDAALSKCCLSSQHVIVDPVFNLIGQFRDILPWLAVDIHRHTAVVDIGGSRHKPSYRLTDGFHQGINTDNHLASGLAAAQQLLSIRAEDRRIVQQHRVIHGLLVPADRNHRDGNQSANTLPVP